MRDFAILLVHLIVILARLAKPGGLRSVVAESVVGHQKSIRERNEHVMNGRVRCWSSKINRALLESATRNFKHHSAPDIEQPRSF